MCRQKQGEQKEDIQFAQKWLNEVFFEGLTFTPESEVIHGYVDLFDSVNEKLLHIDVHCYFPVMPSVNKRNHKCQIVFCFI